MNSPQLGAQNNEMAIMFWKNKPTVFNMPIILLADLKMNRLSKKMQEMTISHYVDASFAGSVNLGDKDVAFPLPASHKCLSAF